MPRSRVKLGYLVPVKNNLDEEEDQSIPKLDIFEGINFIGRDDIAVSDKRVSRKHISLNASLDGSLEVTVEGGNPIAITFGDGRKKFVSKESAILVQGDIVELIPGHHFFKYVKLAGDNNTLSLGTDMKLSEDESINLKRKRQIDEDEALARTLQDEMVRDVSALNRDMVTGSSSYPMNQGQTSFDPHDDCRAICQFNVAKDKLPLGFRLLRVKGLPSWANSSSVSIQDVIQGNVLVAVLSNYMVDMDWLISACPILTGIPRVLVIHGEGDGTLSHLQKNKPVNWVLHKPPLPISYGTHHSKAMFLVYPKGLRVAIHTANLIHVDWNNKSQGLWMQDFPWKDQNDQNKRCGFENDLVDYLSALKWPEIEVNLPVIGNVKINSSFFRKFDYSSAAVRLIGSVPGYHTGSNLRKWGHMKLRSVLQDCVFDKEFQKSPLVYQFSSLGSLDEKWMAELAASMSSGSTHDKKSLGLGKELIVWPTVEDVRCSLEGYAAGSCIPSPEKNVEKDFLKKYWAKWKANHSGRSRAMPHIKTYTRYSGQDLAWFLLTSANLSKAAWGALQKKDSQLMIRSYELGVLFLPTSIKKDCSFSCTDNGGKTEVKSESSKNVEDRHLRMVTLCWKGNKTTDSSTELITLPVPYELPPQPYSAEDVPWSWDRRHYKKDVHGQVWAR